MAQVESLEIPYGWLIDPHNKWAIHFDYKTNASYDDGSEITIDMWGVDSEGKPFEFKSRRKATKSDSIKTWKQLISSNWTKLNPHKIKLA